MKLELRFPEEGLALSRILNLDLNRCDIFGYQLVPIFPKLWSTPFCDDLLSRVYLELMITY